MMFFPINSMSQGGRKDDGYTIGPATKAWYEKVRARCAQPAIRH